MTGFVGKPAAAINVLLVCALLLPAAGCGTKTELSMPNGKPAPHDQRDPSQPPSPLSR
jgi:predicted small lipoprotein YifL